MADKDKYEDCVMCTVMRDGVCKTEFLVICAKHVAFGVMLLISTYPYAAILEIRLMLREVPGCPRKG